MLATGDFNTIEEEKDPTRHPFTHSLLNPDKLGHLYDVQDALRAKEGLPPGTYYYIPRGRKAAPSWNRLDRFLASKGLLGRGGLHIDRSSYEIVIVEESSQTIETEGGKIIIPKGFDPMTGEGITDHFPIRIRLRSR